jgi:uncharacterized protein YndB with AHSA1/START domain
MATLRKRIRIAAPPAAVYAALTDPAALRVWLAEQADVDLPGRYQFWGRSVPEGETPRQQLRHVDGSSLRFDWELDGTSTTVDIGVTPGDDSGSTLLTLVHTGVVGWPDVVMDINSRGLMHTFWALTLANLADYAEGRAITQRCDFTSAVLRGEIVIDADRQAVFESLTEPELFTQWFGVMVEAELRPGGRWAMGGFEANPEPARILDIRAGHSMSVDWGDMVQSWELDDAAGGTRLTFVHSGFDEERPPYAGWLGLLAGMAELRRFHEIQNWRAMWVEVYLDGIPDGLLTSS